MDILLDENNDIAFDGKGDLTLVESIIQEARTRVMWMFGEYRYGTDMGCDRILGMKNPDLSVINGIVSAYLEEIEGVYFVEVDSELDDYTRKLTVRFTLTTSNGEEEGEITLDG